MDSMTVALMTYLLTIVISLIVSIIIKIIVFYIHKTSKNEDISDEQNISLAVDNDVEIALAIALAKKGK
jgi:hypothetical protein